MALPRRLHKFLDLIALFVICALPVSGASPLQLSGSLKTYVAHMGGSSSSNDVDSALWDTPLRLRLFYQTRETFSLEVAEELNLRHRSHPSLSASPLGATEPSLYRLLDPARYLSGSPGKIGASVLQNLDRLALALHFGRVDLIVGRQVVSFGSGRAVNPTDLLAPFDPQNPDTENPSGVDAFRVRVAWGSMGELDVGYVAGHRATWDESALFLKPRFRLFQIDVAPLAMAFHRNFLAGIDLQGSIGGAGTWCEGAWVQPKASDGPYLRVSAGSDYNLRGNLYGFLEYHFNGAGESSPEDYLRPSHPTAYREGSVFLRGRHYLIPALHWQATALLNIQVEASLNLGDGSLLPSLHAEYNLARNLYLDLGAAFPIGRDPVAFLPSSEYGLTPSLQYLYMRFYF
jgi:hypothetical protein